VLGAWEFALELDTREGAIFLHPGIYSFYDIEKKETTKTRGFKIDTARDFMMRKIVQGWKRGGSENKLPMETTAFMTLGMAVSSEENWKKCGSWRTQNRDMNLNAAGNKRVQCADRRRAGQLVLVPPACNREEDQLSCPYYPDWIDDDGLSEHQDELEIGFKFGELEAD
jgi:hypothetical protein